ncbi:MAG: hypothetical protein JWO89_2560 [Verrucomicrobiaceae bacterium]|nr:hypothetical protein [Verrucomicrobiaceae bacterium]
MNLKLPLFILAALTSNAFAGSNSTKVVQETQPPVEHIYNSNAFDIETGGLWQVGTNTPIDYKLWETQLSWRTGRMFGWDFADGSSLSVRNRFTVIGTAVVSGPENHYFAVSASPSVEWWNKTETFSIYGGAGGGIGVIDSQGVPGGQGQDRTLNWFAQLGVQTVLTDTLSLKIAAMFQHMSNGGATDPNPGIDALGFSVGCSWRF